MFMKKSSKWNKPIIISKSFVRKVKENSISFLKNLMINIKANEQDKIDLLKVIKEFFKKNDISKINIGTNIRIILQMLNTASYLSL